LTVWGVLVVCLSDILLYYTRIRWA